MTARIPTAGPYNPWNDLPGLMRELRAIAEHLCRCVRNPDLEASDLRQAALLHLYKACKGDWKNKEYFFAAVRQAMIQHMADIRRKSAPRGATVPLDSDMDPPAFEALSNTTALALSIELKKLETECEEFAQAIGEYHFVGEEEPAIATKLGVSLSSAKRYRAAGESAIAAGLGIVPKVGARKTKPKP